MIITSLFAVSLAIQAVCVFDFVRKGLATGKGVVVALSVITYLMLIITVPVLWGMQQ